MTRERQEQLANYAAELLDWFNERGISVPEQTGIMMALVGVQVANAAHSKKDAKLGLELAFNIARSAACMPIKDVGP